MAHRIHPRVLETSSAPGTGNIALAGAVLGFLAFSAIPGIANNDTVEYVAEGVDANGALDGKYEWGMATYNSTGPALARTTILGSSNGGSAVNFNGTTRVALGFVGASGTLPRQITGAATLTAADVGPTLRFNSGSTAVLTVPSDATLGVVGSKVGNSQIVVYVQGAGVPTFTGSGSTIQGTAPSGLAQFSTIVLNHTGNANEWSYA